MMSRVRARFRRVVRVGVANIRNNPDMAREKVRADAAAMGRESDVVLFQEIGEAEDHVDVRAGLGAGWRLVSFGGLPIPIAFRRLKFKLVDKGSIKLHDGSAKVPNPDRHLSWVILKPRWRRNAKPVVFLCTHWVNGAWNEKAKPYKKWRQAKWRIDFAMSAAVVQAFADEDGLTAFLGGDLNKYQVDKLHPDWQWLANATIVKLGVVEGSTEVERIGVRSVKLHSDHNGWVAEVAMKAAA